MDIQTFQARFKLVRREKHPYNLALALKFLDIQTRRLAIGLYHKDCWNTQQKNNKLTRQLAVVYEQGRGYLHLYQYDQQCVDQVLRARGQKIRSKQFQETLSYTLLEAYNYLIQEGLPIPLLTGRIVLHYSKFVRQNLHFFKYFYFRPLAQSQAPPEQRIRQLVFFLIQQLGQGPSIFQRNKQIKQELLKLKLNTFHSKPLAQTLRKIINSQGKVNLKELLSANKLQNPLKSIRQFSPSPSPRKNQLTASKDSLQTDKSLTEEAEQKFLEFQNQINRLKQGQLILLKNGDLFGGKVQKGLFVKGLYVFVDKQQFFKGTFKQNHPSFGIYRFVSGDYYSGNFQRGYKHGKGIMRYKQGDWLIGFWQNDCFVQGHARYAGGQYFQGKWAYKQGDVITWGRMTYSNGDIYEGTFVQGQRKQGRYTMADGRSVDLSVQ